jgi:hypothetical protein
MAVGMKRRMSDDSRGQVRLRRRRGARDARLRDGDMKGNITKNAEARMIRMIVGITENMAIIRRNTTAIRRVGMRNRRDIAVAVEEVMVVGGMVLSLRESDSRSGEMNMKSPVEVVGMKHRDKSMVVDMKPRDENTKLPDRNMAVEVDLEAVVNPIFPVGLGMKLVGAREKNVVTITSRRREERNIRKRDGRRSIRRDVRRDVRREVGGSLR